MHVCCRNICDVLLRESDRIENEDDAENPSDASAGAYFVHVLVLEALYHVGINSMTFNPILAVPVTSFLAIMISFAISIALKRIPVVGKWIV